jgi:hypothetical protein
MKPDTFTITTFWLDWLLVPVMLAGAWLTARWALADSRQASKLEAEGKSFISAWAFSIPLLIAAAAWIIAGLGTLIREDYWEMRMIFAAFVLWTLCCIFGAGLVFLGILRKSSWFGAGGILSLLGLALMSLLMFLPGLVDHSSPTNVNLIGHIWFVLLAVSVGLLLGGVILGFPYKFPRFPLGLGAFFLVGWGLSEIAFRQASFPWLVRIWKLHLGLEYLDAFPMSAGWQIVGAVKVLAGIGAALMLIPVIRHQQASEKGVLQRKSNNGIS